MERLTKRSEETTHENGVCCTHFGGLECCEVGGNCAMNCKWEEAAWSRLAAYEDTKLTPELVRETAELAIWIHENGLEKIKKWIKADKESRLIIVDNTPRQISPCDTCKSG